MMVSFITGGETGMYGVMVSWGQREHLTGPYTALAGASFSVASGSTDAQACDYPQRL
jgi:hypothetical protein